MATATIVTDLSSNLLTNCDSTTADGTWSGVSAGLGTTDPLPLEGSGRLDFIVKSTTDVNNDLYFAPTASVDISNEHLRLPLYTALKAVLKTSTANAIDIILSDGTNTAYYTVSGSDIYIGGWESLVLDVNATPWSGTAPTMTAITSIGWIFRLNSAAKNVDTVWLDYLTFGDGFQSISGGTSGDELTFDDIDTADVYYKIFEKLLGTYRARGELVFGSSGTATTYFKDAGKILMFDDLIVSSTLYKIKGIGNTTGTTDLDFSNILFSTAGASFLVDFTDSNLDVVTLDNATFQGANNVNLGSAVSGSGTVFDSCNAVSPSGATLTGVTIKNTQAPTTTGSLALTNSSDLTNLSKITFNNYTSKYAVYIPATVTGTITFNGFIGDASGTDVYWAATSGTLTINKSNGTNFTTWSAGGTATVSLVTSVSIDINVQDQSGTDISGAYVYVDEDLDTAGSIVNTTTDVNGDVSTSYSGGATSATIRVRKYGYKPYITTISLSSDSQTNVVLITDPQQT